MKDIREEIKERIKANRREEITGPVLQGVLLDMVGAMENSQYLIDATEEFGYVGDFPGALQALVAGVRTSAVFVSFLTAGGMRELWQFNGGEFSDAGNWRQFTGGIEEIPPAELDALIEEILTLNQ